MASLAHPTTLAAFLDPYYLLGIGAVFLTLVLKLLAYFTRSVPTASDGRTGTEVVKSNKVYE